MKIIKGLLIAFVALFAIWVMLALFSPKEYSVTRVISTEATPSQVWSQISTFEKWQVWSPWKQKDATLKSTFDGTPGTIGSKTNWVGDPKLSGKGSMVITEVIPNEKLAYGLQFEEFSESNGAIELSEDNGKTVISWNDKGDLPFLMRPVTLFGMFDNMMGPDFEIGLNNIKKLAEESEVVLEENTAISKVVMQEANFLGKRYKTSMSEVITKEFFSNNYELIFGEIVKNNIVISGNSSCIYYSWNELDSTTEVFPCVPVQSKVSEAPEGLELVSIPKSNAVKGTFYGSFEGSIETHIKMDEFCKKNNLNTGLVIEEYENASSAETEEELITNIYYLIVE